ANLAAGLFKLTSPRRTRRCSGRLFLMLQRRLPLEWRTRKAMARILGERLADVAHRLLLPAGGEHGQQDQATRSSQRYWHCRTRDNRTPNQRFAAGKSRNL